MADWMDDLFSSGVSEPQAQPMAPAYDPTVGFSAAAPFSGADTGGGLPQMGQTDARTGATQGTPNPDFLQVLMRVLANTQRGRKANAISQAFGGPDLSKLDPSKLFGGSTKYTSTYRESPVPQQQPMQSGGGGDAAGKMAGILSLVEMY